MTKSDYFDLYDSIDRMDFSQNRYFRAVSMSKNQTQSSTVDVSKLQPIIPINAPKNYHLP